jgi:manganese/zinc/iron transport system ATP- binding protein
MIQTNDHPTALPAQELPVIVCQDLTVAYGDEVVLHKVTLEIGQGEFLPFVGPNGSGKTTLLRTILGLISPRAGCVQTPFAAIPPGYVAQAQSIDPVFPITAREMVEMGLFPHLGWWRRPSADHRRAVDDLLHRFHLLVHQHKLLSELSGGMRQKVLIARALVNGATVLIMDEPTTGLDEESERDILFLLHELAVKNGKTVLFAQHGLDLIAGLATTVIRLHKGKAWREALGQPKERSLPNVS